LLTFETATFFCVYLYFSALYHLKREYYEFPKYNAAPYGGTLEKGKY